MLRLVFIAVIIYLFYWLLRVFFGKNSKISKGRSDGVIDEMVQDPYCMKYIPQREAVRRVIEGNEIFFCSRECAEKFDRKRKV